MHQRPANSPQNHGKVSIQWRGKPLTIAEAGTAAVQEQRQGNLQAAVDIFNLILAKVSNSAELHNNRGAILQMMKRYDEALASYDKAIALKPDYANAHFNRGSALKQLNHFEEALASYDKAIALNPGHAEAHNNRGALLQQMRRYDEAIASYDKAIAAKPDHAAAYNNRGTTLLSKGDMREAEKMFRKALELKPDFSDPLHSLVNMRRYRNAEDASSADVKDIRALLGGSKVTPEEKEHLYFALGKIYDDCGLYDEAFENFQQANQIRNSFVSYKAEDVTRLTDGIIEVFSQDFLNRKFAFASESKLSLFIVGMPRSGTTLLGSILSNHPAIATAGELPDMADYALHLGDMLKENVPYPQAAKHITPEIARHIISQYEKRLKRDVKGDVQYVIDKNPLNFRHLGFISMLFPQARIIHCRREPLDTVLSNYFTRFPLTLDYSFDLRNIGHFYREYARLMEHWRTIPALRMMDVSYENMILHTEQTARAVLEFLGLEWDERCLTPHTNPSPVETASQWQVRQPIYRDSLERWRHYEKHLGPLKETLAGD
jgi:tetratricopeptide (TPR) repeat protein